MTVSRSLSGLRLVPGYLDRASQEALLSALGTLFAAAPLYTPRMPKSGKPLSVTRATAIDNLTSVLSRA